MTDMEEELPESGYITNKSGTYTNALSSAVMYSELYCTVYSLSAFPGSWTHCH